MLLHLFFCRWYCSDGFIEPRPPACVGSFTGKCEAAGMRVRTTESEVMVPTVVFSEYVESSFPRWRSWSFLSCSQVKEDWSLKLKGQIGLHFHVIIVSVHHGKVGDVKVKLSIYLLIFVPIFNYGDEPRVMTKRMRSQIQAAKIRFLCRMVRCFFRDAGMIWVTLMGLGVKLFHIKRLFSITIHLLPVELYVLPHGDSREDLGHCGEMTFLNWPWNTLRLSWRRWRKDPERKLGRSLFCPHNSLLEVLDATIFTLWDKHQKKKAILSNTNLNFPDLSFSFQ